MAWVLINKLNVDTCLIINDHIVTNSLSEMINDLFKYVEIEFNKSLIEELNAEGNIFKICRWVEIARTSNILTRYVKRKLQLWREEEEYIHEYDDGPHVHLVEIMRWRIDCCCEYY